MSKSFLSLPHLILSILSVGSYLLIAVMMLWKKVTTRQNERWLRPLAWIGLVCVFVLVDTGFIMFQVQYVPATKLHHPLGFGAMLLAGVTSITAVMSKRRKNLADVVMWLALATIVLLILTSIFASGS